jgi:2-oxoglutarate dehydrogenase E2 component (dihydrolipoamide succinyltransferase)
MPQLGETVVEGTITRWLKKEGESVARDEPLFEISTDKVDTEVPSPIEGKLVEIKVPEGETVSVGTELAMIDTAGDGQAAATASEDGQQAGERPAEEEAAPAEAAASEEPAPKAETEPEEAERADEEHEREERTEPKPAEEQPVPSPRLEPSDGRGRPPDTSGQAAGAQPASAEREEAANRGPRAGILSPLVRRLAEENQIDLSQVTGTGTGGRITKKDVMAFMESRAERPQPVPEPQPQPGPIPQPEPMPRPEPVPQPMPRPEPMPQPEPIPQPPAVAASVEGAREEAIPLSRMRQAIAKHMVASMQTSARAWNLVEVDMENVVRTRQAAKDSFRQREGSNLTYMPFVARAVCEALLAFPEVNSELREDQLIVKRYVNLGIAVALDDGLIVPVVKGADSMNIVGLSRAINDIATRARNRKLVPDEVHGSTFTITNPGPFG